MRVLLSDHKLVGPEGGLEGWIAKRTGKLEHEVEATAARDFVIRAESCLKRMKIMEVLLSLLDDDEAYRIDENAEKDLNNLQEVIEKTMFKVVNAEHQPLRVLLEAYGKTADFELQLQMRFNQVHPVGEPCILLYVWALQEALWKNQDESEFEYEDRINNLLLDENRVRQLEEDGRSKIQPLMRSYEEVLKDQFDVVEILDGIEDRHAQDYSVMAGLPEQPTFEFNQGRDVRNLLYQPRHAPCIGFIAPQPKRDLKSGTET